MTTNNLGDQAQTGTLIVNNIVRSPSFSQPCLVRGSADAPSPSGSLLTYVEGINKYIFYYQLLSGVDNDTVFVVNQPPRNLSANYSTFSSVVAVASTQFDIPPKFSSTHQFQVSPNGNFNRSLAVYPIFDVLPEFSTGTAYMKVIIQFSLD